MSQRANPFAVGLFFSVATLLLVAALFFFGAGNIFRKSETFVVFFEGSITGLKVGAPVTFQGVQIGQVKDIRLSISAGSDDIVIPVLISIDRSKFTEFTDNKDGIRDRMIARGLRTQLKLQSVLTSLLLIELDFFPGSPLRLRGLDPQYTELPSVPTPLQELMKNVDQLNLNELIHSTRQTIVGIEKLVNHPDTQGSVTELRKLLQNTNEAVLHFDQEAVPALRELQKTLTQVSGVTADIQKQYPGLADELEKSLKALRQAVERFDKVTAEAQFILSADSALYQDLQKAAQDVSNASRSVKEMSEAINDQPESLLFGKPSTLPEK